MMMRQEIKWSFEAIGTSWEISLYQPVTTQQYEQLQTSIHQKIAEFDLTYSRFRLDSIILQLSQPILSGIQSHSVEITPEGIALFDIYKELYTATKGLCNPCVGATLNGLGYDSQYSLTPGKMSAPPSFDVVTLDGVTLSTTQPVCLDFGAGGKGCLIDILANILESQDITSYTINGSGDIIHHSDAPLRVGLEHPVQNDTIIGITSLTQGSLCASATNRRQWRGYHHIINPHTLTPVRDILATWVIAPTTLLADMIATCLFLVPPEPLKEIAEFEHMIIDAKGKIDISKTFSVEWVV